MTNVVDSEGEQEEIVVGNGNETPRPTTPTLPQTDEHPEEEKENDSPKEIPDDTDKENQPPPEDSEVAQNRTALFEKRLSKCNPGVLKASRVLEAVTGTCEPLVEKPVVEAPELEKPVLEKPAVVQNQRPAVVEK